jgi:hypothetical protein
MTPKDVKSNEDLYEYICWLAQELRERGQENLADRLAIANNFACGSPSEFLHEAGCSLKDVIASAGANLSDAEKEDVVAVIRLIEDAFKKVGGA